MDTSTEPSGDPLPLMIWLSPAFPVGSYAYSHGLEWAVEAGDVRDAETCAVWLADLVEHGGGWADAVLLAAAHRAASQADAAALAAAAEFAAALAPTRERRLETLRQGEAFMIAVRAAWPWEGADRANGLQTGGVAFPIAVGVAAAGHGIALKPTIEAYLVAFVSNLASAAVRLVPLGQTDATRIVARLTPLAREIAARAARSSLDHAGSAALRSDIASMRHETQHTRLFRS